MSGEYDDEDRDPMIVDSLDAKFAHRFEDVDDQDIPRDSLDDSPVGDRGNAYEQENRDPNMQLNDTAEEMDTDQASPNQNEPYDSYPNKNKEPPLSRGSGRGSGQLSHPGSGTQRRSPAISQNGSGSNYGSPARNDYGLPPRGPSAGSRGGRSTGSKRSGSPGSKYGNGLRPPGSRGSGVRGTPPQQSSPGIRSQGSAGSGDRRGSGGQQFENMERYPPSVDKGLGNSPNTSPKGYGQPMQYDEEEEEDDYRNPIQPQKEEDNESVDSLDEEEQYQAELRERLAKSLHDIRRMEEEEAAARAKAEAEAQRDIEEEEEDGDPGASIMADSLDTGANNPLPEDSLEAGTKDTRRDEDERFIEQPTPGRDDQQKDSLDEGDDQFFGVPKRLSAHSHNRLGSSTLPKSGDSSKRQSYIKEQNQQSFLKHGEQSKTPEKPAPVPPPDDPAEEVRVEYISEESDDEEEHFVDEKGSPVDNRGRPLYETASAKSLTLSEQRRQFVLKSRLPKPPSHPNSVESSRRKYSGAKDAQTPGSSSRKSSSRKGSGSSARREAIPTSGSSKPGSGRRSSKGSPAEESPKDQISEDNQRIPASREQSSQVTAVADIQQPPVHQASPPQQGIQTPQRSQGYQTPQQRQIPQGYQGQVPPEQFQHQPPPPQQYQPQQPQQYEQPILQQYQQQPIQQQFQQPQQQQYQPYQQHQDPQQYRPPYPPNDFQQQPPFSQPNQPYQQPFYPNQHTSPPQFQGYGPGPQGPPSQPSQPIDPRYQQVPQRHPSYDDPRYNQIQRQEQFGQRVPYQGAGPIQPQQTPPQPWQAHPNQQRYNYQQPQQDVYEDYQRPPFPPYAEVAPEVPEPHGGSASDRSQPDGRGSRPKKYKTPSPAKPVPNFVDMNKSNVKRDLPRKTYSELHAKKMVTPPLNPNAPLPNISRESSEDIDPESVWAQRSRSLQKFKQPGSKQGNSKKVGVSEPWTKQLVSEQRNLPIRTQSDTVLRPKQKMVPINPSPRTNRPNVNLDINVNIKRLGQSQDMERDDMDIDVQVTPRPDHYRNYENPYINPNIREPPPQNFGHPSYNRYARQSSEPMFPADAMPGHTRRYSDDNDTYRAPGQYDPREYDYNNAVNVQEFYEETPRLSYTHPLDQHAVNPYGVLPNIDHKDDRSSRASQEGGYLAMMHKKKGPPQYKQYTLKDYRSLKSDLRLGGLGPDHDIVQERQEKANRGREYARQVAQQNRRALTQQKPRKIPRPGEGSEQTDLHSKRHVSLVYAKHVPKPKVKNYSASSTPVADQDEIKTPRELAIEYSRKIKKPVPQARGQDQGQGQPGGSPEMQRSPSKYSHLEEDMAKLEELKARHERERHEIEKLKHEVPTQS